MGFSCSPDRPARAVAALRSPAVLFVCAAACLLGAPGCSLALQTPEDQCTVDADCTDLGTAFAGTVCTDHVCVKKAAPPDPKWGCIGHVPAPTGGGMDTLKVQLLDLITGQPAKGVDVKLCSKYDTNCDSPLGTPVPDAMSFVTVTVASDAEVYLDLTSPSNAYMPSLSFLDHVAVDKNPDILLVSPGAAMGLATTASVTLDPSKGVVLVRTADCTHTRTAGVSLSLSPAGGETQFYLINDAATRNATQTDSAGNAGFANVTVGNPTVTGTVAASGTELGKVTTLVRAGTFTYEIIRPTNTL